MYGNRGCVYPSPTLIRAPWIPKLRKRLSFASGVASEQCMER